MKKKNADHISLRDLSIVPLTRAETLPSSWYSNPGFHLTDTEYVFSKTWQYVGHVSQVAKPGDYILGTVASNPVLLIRGKDGVLRGFFNVCRHRGGPLAIEEQGSCSILQCKYHGWTYLLDGSLRGTPKFDRTELFDKKDFGLLPIRIELWEGLIFANLSRKPDALTSVMQGIPERIKPHSLAGKNFFRRVAYDVNCNWKAYVDNYLEGYHLPFVHPELCNLLDYQKYVTETYESYSLQYSPFTGKDNVYTAGDGEAYYYFVFPNFMMNILPGRLQTNLVLPLAQNKCRVIFDYYYDDATSASALKRIQDDLDYSDKVQQEDIEICELVQRGLESIAYDKGRFSPEMEEGVYHFQSLLKKAYKRNLNSRRTRKA
ncbi:MAG TPA: aromatic ring-hydroxylating dioxygenase subunit alpha [Bacteroidota bacterium]|nr:aromatic ring-hydroxylating dioxygenase subunit alpha [Bacteroidota bacterium]